MTERTQITDHGGSVETSRGLRRQPSGTSHEGSARDEVLSLQRSAGNAAVVARLRESGTQSAPVSPVPVVPGAVQREGFFSKAGKWLKKAGSAVWNLLKPKTGPALGGAKSEEGGASAGAEIPGDMSKVTEEKDGGEDGGRSESGEGDESKVEEAGAGAGSEAGGVESKVEEAGAGAGSEAGGVESEKTPDPEKTGPVAPETKKTEPEHPSPPPLAMDLASGEAVLKNAFGSMKTIVPGKIEILAPPAFKVAYDKIYGAGPYSWDRYVVPTYGSLNGFAHDGVNYINTGSAGLHTVVHEMLHNNCASDWIPAVGSRFNEGTTEILTQVACKKLNVDAPVCYPGESPCVQALLDAGLPLADLEAAYLNGGAKAKVCDWVDANCKENWAAFMGYMEAKNWTAAKAAAAKKTA